jgi:hypothetical protein
MATARVLCETRAVGSDRVFPGGKAFQRPGCAEYNGDDRPLAARLREAERENRVLRQSLARQLEISSVERKARELAERSRDEALRACARARMLR